jgi:hypothetical protein
VMGLAEPMRVLCHKNVALDGQRSSKVCNAIQQDLTRLQGYNLLHFGCKGITN